MTVGGMGFIPERLLMMMMMIATIVSCPAGHSMYTTCHATLTATCLAASSHAGHMMEDGSPDSHQGHGGGWGGNQGHAQQDRQPVLQGQVGTHGGEEANGWLAFLGDCSRRPDGNRCAKLLLGGGDWSTLSTYFHSVICMDG